MSTSPEIHAAHDPGTQEALCRTIGARCACFNLRRASRLLTRAYDTHMAPSGLRSTQFSLLAALQVHGPSTLSRLAELMATERTTLTRNLKLLETRGLVLSQSGQDKREHNASITDAGRAAFQEALPCWEKAQAAVEALLGKERLLRLLDDVRFLATAAGTERDER